MKGKGKISHQCVALTSIILGKAASRTPSLYGTVTQRVLIIPELLESIFSFCDTNDNAKNAVVCRAWSEVALDILWKEVDDLPRMFHLLAPTEQCSQGRVSRFMMFHATETHSKNSALSDH